MKNLKSEVKAQMSSRQTELQKRELELEAESAALEARVEAEMQAHQDRLEAAEKDGQEKAMEDAQREMERAQREMDRALPGMLRMVAITTRGSASPEPLSVFQGEDVAAHVSQHYFDQAGITWIILNEQDGDTRVAPGLYTFLGRRRG